jgi:hypothetical protein
MSSACVPTTARVRDAVLAAREAYACRPTCAGPPMVSVRTDSATGGHDVNAIDAVERLGEVNGKETTDVASAHR